MYLDQKIISTETEKTADLAIEKKKDVFRIDESRMYLTKIVSGKIIKIQERISSNKFCKPYMLFSVRDNTGQYYDIRSRKFDISNIQIGFSLSCTLNQLIHRTTIQVLENSEEIIIMQNSHFATNFINIIDNENAILNIRQDGLIV